MSTKGEILSNYTILSNENILSAEEVTLFYHSTQDDNSAKSYETKPPKLMSRVERVNLTDHW